MKNSFTVSPDGIWKASFEPEQIILSEFLEGDLTSVDACDSLLGFINSPDDEAWSGETGSVIPEGKTIILESLWREGYPSDEYPVDVFTDIVKSWKIFFRENDLP